MPFTPKVCPPDDYGDDDDDNDDDDYNHDDDNDYDDDDDNKQGRGSECIPGGCLQLEPHMGG